MIAIVRYHDVKTQASETMIVPGTDKLEPKFMPAWSAFVSVIEQHCVSKDGNKVKVDSIDLYAWERNIWQSGEDDIPF